MATGHKSVSGSSNRGERLPDAPLEHTKFWGPFTLLALAGSLIVAGSIAYWTGDASVGEKERPVIQIAAGQAPVIPSPPVPQSVEAVKPPVLSTSDRIRILKMLNISPYSSLRNVSAPGPRNGTICGEIQPQGAATFKNFIYVVPAGLAAIDDGTPTFRKMAADSCGK